MALLKSRRKYKGQKMVKITDGFRHISDISKYNYNAMNKKIKTSFKSTPMPVFSL